MNSHKDNCNSAQNYIDYYKKMNIMTNTMIYDNGDDTESINNNSNDTHYNNYNDDTTIITISRI